MKILLGNDTYLPDVNGAAYFTRRLAEGLAEQDHEVHVMCASRNFRTEVAIRNEVVEHRMLSVPVPFHAPFRFSPPPFLYNRVLREAERIGPDVIHVQGHFFFGQALIRAARELSVPIVATNHFMPDNLVFYLNLPERAEKALTEWAWRDFAGVFNRADVVTAPTPFAAHLAEEKGVRRPVLSISNGMDLSRFHPGNDGTDFRRKYGIPERPTYMYVGRLDAEKRVDELIRVLPLVRGTVDAQLVIVGDGHERQRLIELAEEEGVEGRVIFTGFVEDEELPGAYAASDVFSNAGIAELQSIVTMEAMATGKPVVAANAKALPHLVHDGHNGYLFEPGDVKGLASRLAELLGDEDRRTAMGAKSLGIIARHDIEEVLAAFEELYELVMLPRCRGGAPRGKPYVARHTICGLRKNPRGVIGMETVWSKADLHVHTTHSDGHAGVQEVLWHAANRTDLGVIAITDHDTVEGALEARELAGEYGIEVVVGEEISTADGELLALFVGRKLEPGLPAAETIAAVHAQGGLAVAAHPYCRLLPTMGRRGLRERSSGCNPEWPLDAIEGFNAGPLAAGSNRRADVLGHPQVGGSDSHHPKTIGYGYTLFPGRGAADLRVAIELGRTVAAGHGWGVARTAEVVGLIARHRSQRLRTRLGPRVIGGTRHRRGRIEVERERAG